MLIRALTAVLLSGSLQVPTLRAQPVPHETWTPRYGNLVLSTDDRDAVTRKLGFNYSQFVEQAAYTDGDENWDSTFTGSPGADGLVNAVAVLGPDVYVAGAFSTVGAGTVSASSIARWDGSSWSALGVGLENTHSRSTSSDGVIYSAYVIETTASDGKLYVGGDFDRAGESVVGGLAVWDGSEWQSIGSGFQMENSNAWVSAIGVRGDTVFAGGRFLFADSLEARYIAQWSGTAWAPMGEGLDHRVEDIAVDSTRVIAVGYRSEEDYAREKFVAEWNGSEWVSLADIVLWEGQVGRVDAVTIFNGDVYAGGLFDRIEGVDANSIARWDGEQWHPVGEGVDSNIWRLESRSDGIVATGLFRHAGGQPAGRIAQWDGERWTTFGPGVLDGADQFGGRVDGLALKGDSVFAVGHFSRAGDVFARNAAIWDGSVWSTFGEGTPMGLSSSADAVAIGVDGVYVGGEFSLAGTIEANGIARWDGTSWHALGSGVEGHVNTILVHGSDVYVGGHISKAGNVNVRAIARWDGGQWHPVGAVKDSDPIYAYDIHSLAFYQGELHAAGAFWDRGLERRYPLMRWDGEAWQQLGGEFQNYQFGFFSTPDVSNLLEADSVLYITGSFTRIGEMSARGIARWNGKSWSAVGNGLYYGECCGFASASLAIIGDDLFAGGSFDYAGGKLVNNVARWDGEFWHSLRSGVDYVIEDIAADDQDLYAVGWFEKPGKSIARWDGSSWKALGSGIGFIPHRIAVRNGEAYVAGGFITAGNRPSYFFAHWSQPRSGTAIENAPVASRFALESIYPNPFVESATVRIALEDPGEIDLGLYDILGRKVVTLASGFLSVGIHDVPVYAGNLAPGVYLCRLTNTDDSITLKVVKGR